MNRAYGVIVVLTLALLLGACGKPAAPGNEADSSKVTGNVGTAHAGSSIRLTFFEWDAEPGAGEQLIVEAEVTESGNFSLELPDPLADKFLSPLPDDPQADYCEAGLHVRMSGAETFELVHAGETAAFADVWFGSEPVVKEKSVNVSGVVFLYSDRALEVDVSCTDTDLIGNVTFTETMDATLKAGWNRLVFTAEESEADGHVTFSMNLRTVGKDPAGFSWQITEY